MYMSPTAVTAEKFQSTHLEFSLVSHFLDVAAVTTRPRVILPSLSRETAQSSAPAVIYQTIKVVSKHVT